MMQATPLATRRVLPRFRFRSGGFTLIELLVAIAVLSLMMTLAARIFFDAQTGVQRGLQTSQIIAESRSISQPLTEDVREMNVFSSKYESNSPGFLIIHQNDFPGVLYPAPDDINADPSSWTVDRDGDTNVGEDGGVGDDDRMRSDQIVFFRDANGLESLTPGEDTRYDSDAKARHARIWYGHVSPVTGGNSLDPGDPDYNLASQLVLGRQALLLVEDDAATNYPNGNAGNPGPSGGRVPAATTSPEDSLYLGEHDVLPLEQVYGGVYTLYDDQGVDPAGGPRGLFRTPTYSVAAPGNQSLLGFAASTAADGLPSAFYHSIAEQWLFSSNNRRLQAATAIDTDFTAAGTGGIFDADTIAQLHAAFAPHVADFAIEFAADWTDDWDDTTTPGTRVAGQDGQPDNEPDRDGAGNIVWYTIINPNPDGDAFVIGAPRGEGNYNGIGLVNPSDPVTYSVNSVAIAEFLGNPGTNLTGNPFVYGTDIIFSHTGDDNDLLTPGVVDGCGKYWPYLIRFRYRLMDGKGEFRTIETNPNTGTDFPVVGRWFEQVVPVPRPQGLY